MPSLFRTIQYSFDSNVLIEAWQERYPPSVFPRLWDMLDEQIRSGRITASEEVFHELKAREGDELYKWVSARPRFFFPHSDEVQFSVRDILASFPRMLNVARGKSGGDPWIIAVARVNGACVVTQEHPTSGNEKRPNIPFVCASLNVECIKFVEFLRREGWSF